MKHLLLFVIAILFSALCTAQGTMNYTVKVRDSKGKPMAEMSIVLIEKRTFDRLEFKTDASGTTAFTIVGGEFWSLNIGEMKNYRTIEMPKGGSGSGSASATYNVANWERINQPPVDRSKLKIEVVSQTLSASETIDATHTIVEVTLADKSGKPWPKIDIQMTCFALLKSFSATTDKSGTARFKVPINQNYQLDVDGEIDYDYCDIGSQPSIKQKKYTFEKMKFTESLNADNYLEQKFLEVPIPTSNRSLVTIRVMGGPNDGKNEDVYLDQTYSNKQYHVKTNANGEAQILLPKQQKYIVSFPFQPNADVLDLSEVRGIGSFNRGYTYTPDERLMHPENYVPSAQTIKDYDINDFYQPSTLPKGDELIQVSAKWGNKSINSGSTEAILQLEFAIDQSKINKSNAKPVNIAFVLDKSGSMAGESFDLLKASMMGFINKLSPQDQVSLIFFDHEAVVAYKQQKVSNKGILKDIMHTVTTGGGTSIYDGLKLGYEEVASTFDPDKTNRVILLTDGYGSKPIDFILEQSKAYFSKGISVSTIGVGSNYNDALLTQLSQYSGGMKHHAVSNDGINQALTDEFESLFYPIAKDLSIAVKYNNKIIYKTLYGIPETSNANSTVKFNISPVYSTMSKVALLKFKLNDADQNIAKEVITIEVKHFDEASQKQKIIVKNTNLEWREESNLEALIDDQIKELYSVATINQLLKSIADLCAEKRYTEARANLAKTCEQLKQTPKDRFNEKLRPLIDDLEFFITALDYYLK